MSKRNWIILGLAVAGGFVAMKFLATSIGTIPLLGSTLTSAKNSGMATGGSTGT